MDQVLSNLRATYWLKRLRPSVWLPTIMVAWGIVMTLMGTVSNYAGLLSSRLFLGIAEAGLPPGIAYILSGLSMMLYLPILLS